VLTNKIHTKTPPLLLRRFKIVFLY
jgi:hypothetical protein